MNLQTRYNYEKIWTNTTEQDLLKIITEEFGEADAKGTLLYIKEAVKSGKELGVGSCKFREQKGK